MKIIFYQILTPLFHSVINQTFVWYYHLFDNITWQKNCCWLPAPGVLLKVLVDLEEGTGRRWDTLTGTGVLFGWVSWSPVKFDPDAPDWTAAPRLGWAVLDELTTGNRLGPDMLVTEGMAAKPGLPWETLLCPGDRCKTVGDACCKGICPPTIWGEAWLTITGLPEAANVCPDTNWTAVFWLFSICPEYGWLVLSMLEEFLFNMTCSEVTWPEMSWEGWVWRSCPFMVWTWCTELELTERLVGMRNWLWGVWGWPMGEWITILPPALLTACEVTGFLVFCWFTMFTDMCGPTTEPWGELAEANEIPGWTWCCCIPKLFTLYVFCWPIWIGFGWILIGTLFEFGARPLCMMMLCTGKDVWKFVLLNGTVTGCAAGLELELPNKELPLGVCLWTRSPPLTSDGACCPLPFNMIWDPSRLLIVIMEGWLPNDPINCIWPEPLIWLLLDKCWLGTLIPTWCIKPWCTPTVLLANDVPTGTWVTPIGCSVWPE